MVGRDGTGRFYGGRSEAGSRRLGLRGPLAAAGQIPGGAEGSPARAGLGVSPADWARGVTRIVPDRYATVSIRSSHGWARPGFSGSGIGSEADLDWRVSRPGPETESRAMRMTRTRRVDVWPRRGNLFEKQRGRLGLQGSPGVVGEARRAGPCNQRRTEEASPQIPRRKSAGIESDGGGDGAMRLAGLRLAGRNCPETTGPFASYPPP